MLSILGTKGRHWPIAAKYLEPILKLNLWGDVVIPLLMIISRDGQNKVEGMIARHSGAIRNPEQSNTSWMPAFTGMTGNELDKSLLRNDLATSIMVAIYFEIGSIHI